MPELPEVETVVRDLRPHLVGQRIASVRVGRRALRRPWSSSWGARLTGRRIVRIDRRGKWILVVLEDDLHLVIHLGMTGRLTVVPADTPVAAHTHVVMGLEQGGGQLRFRDVRRFGSATLFGSRHRVDAFFCQAGLGPEPFDLRCGDWRQRLAGTSRCVKAVLLDQRVVAGVGNIYADEALFVARLHPTRPGRDVGPAEAERLRRALMSVLKQAIALQGSSIRDYVGGTGCKGRFQERFGVYGRTGKPCRRCRQPIERIRLAGRSTHFCPGCQDAFAMVVAT